ncbi:NUC091 domain-containing protein [Hyaloraphidium curvatum]|nr:NUC091 domain-containing protein [Hyaloraphidium curvatum]
MKMAKHKRGKAAPGGAKSGASPKGDSKGPSLGNVKVKGTNFYRDAKKVRQVKMLKGGAPVRNSAGKIVKAAEFQSKLDSGTVARVEPNRKWFENTRTIGVKQLEAFREAMSARANDPYTFLMRQNKLPMSLVTDPTKTARVKVLETETFSSTFGPNAQRKRPKIAAGSMEEMVTTVEEKHGKYDDAEDPSLLAKVVPDHVATVRDPVFAKGTSKRIWGELYKVIDSSDVVIQVLDARNPMGTRCRNVEKFLKEDAHKHKHMIFVLNKSDLVPTWVTGRWVKILSREYPTIAFHASVTNSFGKGSLIQLLRQFAKLHSDKKQISVGFVGYPNVGKSSIINTVRGKAVCKTAPIPGETKIWQYITLMKRIYLIDCPGIVYPSPDDSETDIVLKGVVRVENLPSPEEHIGEVLERVKPEYIRRTYDIESWDSPEDFLEKLARKSGRLLKMGEPDLGTVAKMVLNDWLRGKIPFFVEPPWEGEEEGEEAEGGKDKVAEEVAVKQDLRKLAVQPGFSEGDAAGPDGEAAAEEQEDELDWDTVLANVEAEEVPMSAAPSDAKAPSKGKKRAAPEADEDEDEDGSDYGSAEEGESGGEEEDADEARSESSEDSGAADAAEEVVQIPTRKQRMTTSKRKAGNFYTVANVKNRNRKKLKPNPTPPAKGKVAKKGRR